MKKTCQACGVEKDTEVKETYPYPDDGIVNKPVEPLMTIECQGTTDRRVATVCHECFHNLDVDMWISENCWLTLNPVTPFEQLPKMEN